VSWPTGWAARRTGADVVVVTRRTPAAAASVSHLDVILAAGTAHLLDLPDPAPGQPPDSLRVALSAPDLVVTVPPAPTVLTVVLVLAHTRDPSQGRGVTVRSKTGEVVELPETGPGIYRSAPRAWGAAFHPGDLLIGGTAVRKVAPDPTCFETRVYTVDPT
jgi:hypothetical protein